MKILDSIGENIVSAVKNMHFFKKTPVVQENGDVTHEEIVELTEEEKLASFPASADSFAVGVERLGDTSFVDKFDAIDRLNFAISGIQYVKLNKTQDNEKE